MRFRDLLGIVMSNLYILSNRLKVEISSDLLGSALFENLTANQCFYLEEEDCQKICKILFREGNNPREAFVKIMNLLLSISEVYSDISKDSVRIHVVYGTFKNDINRLMAHELIK